MMRTALVMLVSVATLAFSAGVYFQSHPLLLLVTALTAAGSAIALAAGQTDQA